jgi:hypothetical protein
MRRITPRVKRVLIITTSIILLCIALVIMFISPITKYLLEKNDVKWIGRELTMDWAYVNPFTGYIHLSNLKVFEEKGDSIFLSMKGLSVNLSVHKLLSESIEITQLTIDRPWGQIVQRKKQLNITDLINRFTTKGVDPSGTSSSWRTTILNSQIIDGEFHYRELMIPISYFIKKVNIETSGKEADIDTVAATFRFEEGKSRGSVKGNVTINVKDLDYKVFMSVMPLEISIHGIASASKEE